MAKKKKSTHKITLKEICIKCGRTFNLRVEGVHNDGEPVCGNCNTDESCSGIDDGGFLEDNDWFVDD